MNKNKKIIIVTPNYPFQERGACEQDRAQGIKNFISYGYDVIVIVKIFKHHNIEDIHNIEKELGIKIIPVLYKFKYRNGFEYFLRRFINPLFWDGSVYEYADRELKDILKSQMRHFNPDLVWFDYSYLWPLYSIVKKFKKPIVTRSINFEARHFLHEDGLSVLNIIKFIPKFINEVITTWKSDILFSITPYERYIYKCIAPFKKVVNLPLRSMSNVLNDNSRSILHKDGLNIFFMGSTYNVKHNMSALLFVIDKIAPLVDELYPGMFTFNILGAKVPEWVINKYSSQNIVFHGYISKNDFLNFLNGMDIAMIPSLYGAGMQQKIFESLGRGIPTITSTRGLAGYPFEDGVHVLLADGVNDFVEKLNLMRDIDLRKKLSKNAIEMSEKLFNKKYIDSIILDNLNKLS